MPGQIVPQLIHKDAPYIFRLIKENRLQDLMDLLDSRKSRVRVMRIKDVREYTLLTFCALQNNLLALKLLYEHAKMFDEHNASDLVLKEWVNHQTDKGYCALHFAAYNNNLEMTKYLLETLDANMHILNNWD